MSPIQEDAASIFEQSVQYREQLVKVSGIQSDVGQMLVKSANQFISERESTGGKTILAGYPFFEDWGRDTMIAMAGCCITTKQFETAKDIFSHLYAVLSRWIDAKSLPRRWKKTNVQYR